MLHRILFVGTIVLFTIGIVAVADAPTVSIQQQATIQDFPIDVLVTVAVNCGDPAPTEFELEVPVRQGDAVGTSDTVFIPATGGRQVVMLDVFGGPFAAGEASASATLVCGPLIEGFDLGRTINITE